MAAGAAFDIVPYGMEALGVLRIEKGHVAGPELDGRTTARDLGLGRMLSTRKAFIGQTLMARPGLADPQRPALVGLNRSRPERACAAAPIWWRIRSARAARPASAT